VADGTLALSAGNERAHRVPPLGVCETSSVPKRQCRQQILIEAPVEVVWDLVGDPNRHPRWWPTVVDTECEGLEQGCRYRAVVKNPRGKEEEHEFVVDRLDGCHEVWIRCVDIGTYTRFQLTEARGGTFVDAEFGIEPQDLTSHAVSAVAGRRILRRWLEQSIEALELAATSAGEAR
jgi:uncharacterized protein YndB with AHSA1/START domain